MLKKVLAIVTTIFISGCYYQAPVYYENPKYNAQYNPSTPHTNLTMGKIRKHIYRGMTEYEVISVLGSPNMVTHKANGTEAWIYDKQFTKVTKANGLVIFGGSGSEVSFDSKVASPNVTQQVISHKTLTLIIDFNAFQRVSKFNYHYSSF
jgi:outer membrane protein assembly factor BamE (lipoprotein component of BamABCDE complex)